ncbi:MAG: hypothetical protein QM633_03870, partial [Propionicimonas sp.]
FAARAGVEPTRAGWAGLAEDAVLDAQTAFMAPSGPPPATPAEYVASTLAGRRLGLPFVPLTGDDVLPVGIDEGLASGAGAGVALLAGTVAHEFTMVTGEFAETWAGADPVRALVDGGLPAEVAADVVAAHPDLATPALQLGQLTTELSFRIPTLEWADARRSHTWVYDFRWPSPLLGLSFHCLDLPFAWDLLDAEGVAMAAGPQPPPSLAGEMHAAWVRFIASGDPGWSRWEGANPRVFGAPQAETYAATRRLAGALDGTGSGSGPTRDAAAMARPS